MLTMIIDIWMPILGLIDCWGQTSIIPLGHLGTKTCQPSNSPTISNKLVHGPCSQIWGLHLAGCRSTHPSAWGKKGGNGPTQLETITSRPQTSISLFFLGYDFDLMDKLYHVLLKLLHQTFLKSDSMINHGLPQKWKKLPFGQKGVFSHHEFHPPV